MLIFMIFKKTTLMLLSKYIFKTENCWFGLIKREKKKLLVCHSVELETTSFLKMRIFFGVFIGIFIGYNYEQ